MLLMRISAAVAVAMVLMISGNANAVLIGYGPGIGTNTDSAGSRLNVDETFVTLGPGIYEVQDFAINSGNTTGTATPFLAKATGANAYETLWVGAGFSPGATGAQTDTYTPRTELIYLSAATDVYAGFAQDAPLVRLADPGPAGNTDHDGTFTTPTAPGEAISGFSNANLPRNYGFGMNVADLGPYATVNARITADDSYDLYFSLNENETGLLIGSGSGWQTPENFSFMVPLYQEGYFRIVGANGNVSASGVLAQFQLEGASFGGLNSTLLTTDGNWLASTSGFSGSMSPATDLGPNGIGPWGTRPGYSTDNPPHWIWLGSGQRPAGETVYLSFQFEAVPEPSTATMLLCAVAFAPLGLMRRRRAAERALR